MRTKITIALACLRFVGIVAGLVLLWAAIGFCRFTYRETHPPAERTKPEAFQAALIRIAEGLEIDSDVEPPPEHQREDNGRTEPAPGHVR